MKEKDSPHLTSQKKKQNNYNDNKNKHRLDGNLFKLSRARKIIRIKTKPRTTKKTNHKKCKSKFNQRLKTQNRKAKTRYMLEDDSNKTLF